MTTTPSTSTTPPQPGQSTHVLHMEILISYLLRIGVYVSLAVVVTGMFLTFSHHSDYFKSSAAIDRLKPDPTGISDFPHSIPTVIDSVLQGRGKGVVMLGLLLLIATPVARVAVSVVAFLVEHDRMYALITLVVLILLMLSFFVGGEAQPSSSAKTVSSTNTAPATSR